MWLKYSLNIIYLIININAKNVIDYTVFDKCKISSENFFYYETTKII